MPPRALSHRSVLALGLVLITATSFAAELAPCTDDRFGQRAECGHLEVPEDRAAPEGRTIDLQVIVLRAEDGGAREPVFLFAGGPGQAGTDLAELALGPFAGVRQIRDFVLVDQRGTGGSNRIDCPIDAEENPQAAFEHLFDPAGIRECRRRVAAHADPRFYTSAEVVADVDAVREWLGYERILLWGGSGGTRTVLVYMRQYPERVAGAVLDGVAPTDFRAPSGYARGIQDALEKVFEDCAGQASCRAAYPDLRGDLDQLAALFADGPVKTTIRDQEDKTVPVQMYAGDFGYAVRGILYNAGRIAALPGMIHDAAASGDVSDFAQMHWERHVRVRPVVAIGVHLAVICAEDVPFIDRARIGELSRDTLVGTYLIDQYTAACEAWGVTPVDPAFLEPVRSRAPVLIFSGYYDPSTPAAVAEEVARHLPNGRHVLVRDAAHGAQLGCGRQLVLDFLTSGRLDGLGPACEDAGPIVFEVPEPAADKATTG